MAEKKLPSGDVMLYDECDEELARLAWHRSSKGYAICGSGIWTKWFHKEVLSDCPKGMIRDHINNNRLDNRRSNLRYVTYKQNARNRKPHKKNKTGYKGISIHKGKYIIAKIQGDTIGFFQTIEEAARAYDKEAKDRFGEYAYLNFPE